MVDRLQFLRAMLPIVAVFFISLLYGVCYLEKRCYCAIDAVKAVCAVLIVFIHTSPFESVNVQLNSFAVNYLARIAVPFFFISSGFFLFCKTSADNPDMGIIGRYIKRILAMYLFWSAVYFPFTVLQMFYSGQSAFSVFINWLKNMFFTAGYGVLWYLPATAVAVGLVALMLKKGIKINTVAGIGFVLYLIGLCGQSYFGLFVKIPHSAFLGELVKKFYSVIVTTRNGVFEGIVFIALGAKISQKENNGSFGAAIAGFCASMILYSGEFLLVSKMKWRLEYDMYFCLIPCAYFLLKAAVTCKIKIKRTSLLRRYSSLIYFTHMLCAEICWILTPVKNANSLIMFLIIFSSTVLLDTAIIWASQVKKFAFIKKFY